ncbi:hypothetical protein F511_26941 [Dorcoceras hygrometricum]|uniref:Uncharacterized protein n=1 Tax=Dorcoceras hygrometricum TaxID=472368 RepID=A0A2Z7AQI6_9LAMI|nr:hypothetical protein F511_26941 [Dorcoceras hygrometricum]
MFSGALTRAGIILLRVVPAGSVIATHRLNLIANAKRCRINLFKQHRFAIANFKYHLLVNRSLRLDTSSCTTSLYLFCLDHPSAGSTVAPCRLMMSLLMSSTLSAPAELSSSADCDDITADVIIADPALALLYSTADCDDITADVIIADPALALLYSTADCDDITADVIIADPALALLYSTADCDDITADVIIADSRSCASLLIC